MFQKDVDFCSVCVIIELSKGKQIQKEIKMYSFAKYSKEEIESQICSVLKAHCEEYTEFGWLSKKCVLEIILNFVCVFCHRYHISFGKVNTNSVYLPSTLSAYIFPLWSSSILLTIYKPRPVLLASALRDLSTL